MSGKMWAIHFLASTLLASLILAFTRHGYEYIAFLAGYWVILYANYGERE